jgi:hypothetical protein
MADNAKNKTCCDSQKHQGHLCVLHSKGMHKVIAGITNTPTVLCFNCGRKANEAGNVCNPMPLADT